MRFDTKIKFIPLLLALGVVGLSATQKKPVSYRNLSHWTNIATPLVAGAGHERHRGSAWCDYDNDGFLDVYLSHFGDRTDGVLMGSPNQLLRNLGDGNFEEVTTPELAVGSDLSHHPAWADINNDGLPDLFVGQSTNFGTDTNHLLMHDSVGEFTDITTGDPLAMYWMSPRGVAWQDIDNDGFIDLCVANSGGDNQNNWIMMNQGDGTFVRKESELNNAFKEGRGFVWGDFDNDGLADAYITNGSQDELPTILRRNALFRNNGDGTFTNVAEQAGVDDQGHGRGVVWGDINNDGYLDLLVGNSLGMDYPAHNRLFKNNGDGTFEDITESAGIYENVRTRGVSMGDYDNDGYLDLYVVSFGTAMPYNRLFHNNGDETFTDVAGGTPAEAPSNDESSTWTDVNNDGWIDLYIVGGSQSAPGIGENQLLLNQNQNGNHWLQIELCGTVSNRMGIGARVTLNYTVDGESMQTQIREVQSGSGYNSQEMMRMHFGLGYVSFVEYLTIHWPSGIEQMLVGVDADQLLRFVEQEGEVVFDCNRNCIDDQTDIATGDSLDMNSKWAPR